MNQPRRTSEREIACAIIAFLQTTKSRRATIAAIVASLPTFIKLSRADCAKSETRPGEPLWHQVVRNVRSHKSGERYGLIAIEGGFRLAPQPRAAVRHHVASIAYEARA